MQSTQEVLNGVVAEESLQKKKKKKKKKKKRASGLLGGTKPIIRKMNTASRHHVYYT
jgi:hypothetical protein